MNRLIILLEVLLCPHLVMDVGLLPACAGANGGMVVKEEVDNVGAEKVEAEQLAVDDLVQLAFDAEIVGEQARRGELLVNAIRRSPDHATARGHAGYVRLGDQWRSVKNVERLNAVSGPVTEYVNLRNRLAGSLNGEAALARWCRKTGDRDREQFHWANVLQMNSGHAEARRHMGVRQFRGRLMTAEQVAEWKAGMRSRQDAIDRWDPILARWRQEMENAGAPEATAAWREFSDTDDPSLVPSLVNSFLQSEPYFKFKAISVLGNIGDQTATDALVQVALHADDADVRIAAAVELRERCWYGYVPGLMGRLEVPTAYQYSISPDRSSVSGGLLTSQEGPLGIVNRSRTFRVRVPITIRPISVFPEQNVWPIARGDARARQRKKLVWETRSKSREVSKAIHEIETANAYRRKYNGRVYSVLETATGQLLPSNPRSWWDWWKSYNELDESTEKPRYEFFSSRAYTRPVHVGQISCFAAGTPVWAETGAVAIERVRRGDRVLSQDPLTGEMKYQLVLGTTIRPAASTLQIRVGEDMVVTTLGHPFWVSGAGWKMAKELVEGDLLHGVRGGVAIDSIDDGPPVETYNLVVAESSNYFVGKHRLLVHDNTARDATNLPLPGWSATEDRGDKK